MIQFDSQHWQRMFDQSPIGIAIVGLDGEWLKVNQTICELVGYTEVELLNMTFQDITHPQDVDADVGMLKKLIAGEIKGYTMPKRYITKTGKVIWIKLTVGRIDDIKGDALHCVSHIVPLEPGDIEVTKNAQKVAQEANADVSIGNFITNHWQWLTGSLIFLMTILIGMGIAFWTTVDRMAALDEANKENARLILRLIEKSLAEETQDE